MTHHHNHFKIGEMLMLLRDQIKDAILALENDEKDWNDFTIQQVSQAVHDQVAGQLSDQQKQIDTLTASIKAGTTDQALLDRITAVETSEATATAALTDTQTKLTAAQAQLDDTSGAVADFLAAIKAGQSPAAIVAAANALAAATTTAAPAVAAAATDTATTVAAAPPADNTGGTAAAAGSAQAGSGSGDSSSAAAGSAQAGSAQ